MTVKKMTIRKTLLLASVMMALTAFAAPTAVEANEWYTENTGSGHFKLGDSTANGDQVTLTGSLATTAGPGFAFRSGPCNVDATATLWNNAGQATGEVTAFAITTPCNTIVPGCTIEEAGPSTAFPWHIDVTGDVLAITNAGFFNKYNDGCTAQGIPPNVKLGGAGIATAEFNTDTHCIEFNESGDLTGGLGPIKIDGEVCNTDGNTLILK